MDKEFVQKQLKISKNQNMNEKYEWLTSQFYVINLERQLKKKDEVIKRAVEYIKEYMYVLIPDKEYESADYKHYFTYKEWDGEELLQILEDKEVE